MTQHPLSYVSEYPVLLVDDEASNLVVMRAALRREFTVLTARSGEEALRIVAREPVAVVLTDQRMPGMSGVDLCARLLERHPDIRRLLLTAYADLSSAIDAINRGGVEHYIQKPVSTPQLLQILRESIAHVHLKSQVHHLRAELLQQQRYTTMAEARSMALHDLANIHQPLCTSVFSLKRTFEAHTHVIPPRVQAKLAEDIRELTDATRHLVDLHQSAHRTLHAARPPEHFAASEILTLVTHLIQGHRWPHISVETSCAGSSSLFVHRTDIARVLINLVRNALHAIDEAGIKGGRITLRVTDHGTSTRITVADNGPGIPAALQEQVFEAWSSTRVAGDGTGLGLYIARELVAANGGEIGFECPPSGGTTFQLTLPAQAPTVGIH